MASRTDVNTDVLAHARKPRVWDGTHVAAGVQGLALGLVLIILCCYRDHEDDFDPDEWERQELLYRIRQKQRMIALLRGYGMDERGEYIDGRDQPRSPGSDSPQRVDPRLDPRGSRQRISLRKQMLLRTLRKRSSEATQPQQAPIYEEIPTKKTKAPGTTSPDPEREESVKKPSDPNSNSSSDKGQTLLTSIRGRFARKVSARTSFNKRGRHQPPGQQLTPPEPSKHMSTYLSACSFEKLYGSTMEGQYGNVTGDDSLLYPVGGATGGSAGGASSTSVPGHTLFATASRRGPGKTGKFCASTPHEDPNRSSSGQSVLPQDSSGRTSSSGSGLPSISEQVAEHPPFLQNRRSHGTSSLTSTEATRIKDDRLWLQASSLDQQQFPRRRHSSDYIENLFTRGFSSDMSHPSDYFMVSPSLDGSYVPGKYSLDPSKYVLQSKLSSELSSISDDDEGRERSKGSYRRHSSGSCSAPANSVLSDELGAVALPRDAITVSNLETERAYEAESEGDLDQSGSDDPFNDTLYLEGFVSSTKDPDSCSAPKTVSIEPPSITRFSFETSTPEASSSQTDAILRACGVTFTRLPRMSSEITLQTKSPIQRTLRDQPKCVSAPDLRESPKYDFCFQKLYGTTSMGTIQEKEEQDSEKEELDLGKEGQDVGVESVEISDEKFEMSPTSTEICRPKEQRQSLRETEV